MILEINFYSKLSKNICKIHSIYLEQLFVTIFVSLFNKENKKLSVIYPTITSLCLWGALSFKGGVRTLHKMQFLWRTKKLPLTLSEMII